MPKCLYCQFDNPTENTNCQHCAMHLPRRQEAQRKLSLTRFKWFVFALTLFCLLMMFWLPRTVPS